MNTHRLSSRIRTLASAAISATILVAVGIAHSESNPIDDNANTNAYRANPTSENFTKLSDFEKHQATSMWLYRESSQIPQHDPAARLDDFAKHELMEAANARNYFQQLPPEWQGNIGTHALARMIDLRIQRESGDGGVADQIMMKLDETIPVMSQLAARSNDRSYLDSEVCVRTRRMTESNPGGEPMDPATALAAQRELAQAQEFFAKFFRTSLGSSISKVDCLQYDPNGGGGTPATFLSRSMNVSFVVDRSVHPQSPRTIFETSISPTARCSDDVIRSWLVPFVRAIEESKSRGPHAISVIPKLTRPNQRLCGIHLLIRGVGLNKENRNLYRAERRDHLFRSVGTSFEFTANDDIAKKY